MSITSSRTLGERFVFLACLLSLGWLTAAVALSAFDAESGGGLATAEAGSARPAQEQIPPCATALRGSTAARVDCRTASATLHVVTGQTPLLLGDLQARLADARLAGDEATLRLRVRNTGSRSRVVNENGRQFYLTVGGTRLYAQGKQTIASGTAEYVDLRVPLGAGAAGRQTLASDLGVVPFTEVSKAKPSELGVIKLTMDRAG